MFREEHHAILFKFPTAEELQILYTTNHLVCSVY